MAPVGRLCVQNAMEIFSEFLWKVQIVSEIKVIEVKVKKIGLSIFEVFLLVSILTICFTCKPE